ncbi:growth inhibitor PemK [Clostridiales bacterium PH28_bin88]|nr:growth inhibitor PemK [Clostridiales bacterium PH28_bin88]
MGPSRGEVWYVDFDPVKGHEQSGLRPALVVSVDPFNHGPAGLVVVLPITTRYKGIPFHVSVNPPEGGLTRQSFIKCEDIRSLSEDRVTTKLGSVLPSTFAQVEDRLKILLGL